MTKEKLYLLLAQYRFFWNFINRFNGIKFKSKKSIYSVTSKISDIKQDYHYFQVIERWVFNPMFLSIIFAFVLQLSNYPIHEYKYPIRDIASDSLSIRFNIAPSSDYVTFLAAISAVGSVLIGLYYAALMSIQSALYSKLPNNIRDLLAQEKHGNVYMKFLAFVTFLSFVLIAFRLIGFEKIYLVPIVMLIFAGISIFAFIQLGRGAFNFFDPTKLSVNIILDLQKAIGNVKVFGKHFSDKNFQKFNYRIAMNRSDTLITLCDYALNQKHLNGNSLAELNKQIINFLYLYNFEKKLIDPQSLWYEQRYEHKNWYQLDNLDIYTQSGMSPEPNVINNLYWLEKKVIPSIIKSVEKNFINKRYDVVIEIINLLIQYIHILTYNNDVALALDTVKEMENSILKYISPTKDMPEISAIFDAIIMMRIQIFLTHLEKFKDNNLIDDNRLKNINWLDKKSLYRQDFDVYLLEELNDLQEKLKFEYRIENKIITPWWYQNELLKRVKTQRIVQNLLSLFTDEMFEFAGKIDDVPLLKAAYLSRQWEYLQKILLHFEFIKSRWNEFKASRKIDFKWDDIDLESIYSKILIHKKNLLIKMSQTGLQLANQEYSKEHPDYFGEFNTTIENELINIILQDDKEAFEAIFPKYFINSLLAFERLKPTETEVDVFVENKFIVAFAPILDLIDLCGYTKVVSDFYNDQKLWDLVSATWDVYFDRAPEKMNFIALAINITESRFGLAPRDYIRSEWQRKVENFLSEKVATKEYFERGGFSHFMPRTIALHNSPLVRIYTDDRYGIFKDGIDVFIQYYFRQKAGPELDFGLRRRNGIDEDDIQREIEKYNDYLERISEN